MNVDPCVCERESVLVMCARVLYIAESQMELRIHASLPRKKREMVLYKYRRPGEQIIMCAYIYIYMFVSYSICMLY